MQRGHVENGIGGEIGHRPEFTLTPDIRLEYSEPPGGGGSLQVLAPAEAEVIDYQHPRAAVQQEVDQVRTDKTSPTSHKYAFHYLAGFLPRGVRYALVSLLVKRSPPKNTRGSGR
jgi:hypothetical protein